MASSRYRLYIVVTIIVIASAVLFFFLLKPAKAPVDEGGEGVLPEGISIVSTTSESEVVNEKRDYKLQVGNEWNVSGDFSSLVVDNLSNEISGTSGVSGVGCRVVVVATDISKLDDFAKQKCSDDQDCSEYKIEDFNDEVQIVSFVGSFMGSGEKEFYLKPHSSSNGYDRLTFVCSDSTLQERYQNEILPTFKRG